MKVKSIEILNSYFDFIDVSNLKGKCLIFHTKKNAYLFDTGTGKIFLLNGENEMYIFLSLLNQSLEEDIDEESVQNVVELCKKEHLLQGITKRDFYEIDREYIKDKVENELSQITLEVTQQCNLRCKYCIYDHEHENFRNYESKEMTWDIAKRAIDYANLHSKDQVVISFYGGEPLLKFDLIKKSVEYAQSIIKEKALSFSMTTNMVLMDERKADFIAKVPYFSVTASIDGPQHIHDANRVDIKGNGTYIESMKGLKIFVEKLKEFDSNFKNRISLSMVLDQPFLNTKYDEIETFFKELDWLPYDIEKMVTYADYPINHKFHQPREEREYIDSWVLNMKGEDNFYNGTLESVMYPIHARNISETPQEYMKMNGCCVVGSRKLYVTAEGEFLACERIGVSPSLGDVFNGVDFKRLFKYYIDEFQTKSKEECLNCWASTICNVCYARYYDKDGYNNKTKMSVCENTRKELHDFLILYHTYLENNPEVIKKLNNIVTVS